MENIQETQTVDLYAPRRVVLVRQIKGKDVEHIHQTARLSDEVWLDFNKLLNPRRALEKGKLIYKDDSETAIRATYKKLVPTVPEGYQQFFKKPLTEENYGDLIPLEDQQSVLEEVFSFDVYEPETEEFFFDDDGIVSFDVDVPVSGDVQKATVAMNPKTKAAEKVFKEATMPNAGNVRRFRNAEISASVNITKLTELYRSLATESAPLPVWIQVGVLDYYFVQYAQSEIKN